MYVAAFVAAVAVGGRLLAGTLAAIALVCAYSVGQRLLQGPPDPPLPFSGTFLQEPLGYANALGGLAAIGLAIDRRARARPSPAAARPRPGRPLRRHARADREPQRLAGRARGRSCRAPARLGAASPRRVGARPSSDSRWRSRWRCPRARSRTTWRREEAAAARGTGTSPGRRSRAAPVAGRGAGTFELAWLEEQPIPESVLDAHSLYLETLAELGLVGLGLLALALAPPLLAAFRGASPAAAGGYVAFLFHAGVEWDWEMPAVTVAGLLCGAALLRCQTLQDPSREERLHG